MFYHLRVSQVLRRLKEGRTLDLGCGKEILQGAIGVELREFHQPESLSIPIDSLYSLPFTSGSFDTVCLMAVLNYVPKIDRESLVKEVHRVLSKYGRLVVSCVHRIPCWHPYGLDASEVRCIFESNHFRLVYDKPFMLGLNRIYVFGREELPKLTIAKEECHEDSLM